MSFKFSSDSSTSRRECRVGQYVVDVASFEQLVLPVLRNVSIILKLLKKWMLHDNDCYWRALLQHSILMLIKGLILEFH